MAGHVRAFATMYREMPDGEARERVKARLEEARRHLEDLKMETEKLFAQDSSR